MFDFEIAGQCLQQSLILKLKVLDFQKSKFLQILWHKWDILYTFYIIRNSIPV